MSNNVKISISGDLGSGKSAVSALLCERFHAEYYSTGRIQRDLANKLNVSTYELNTLMEQNPQYDNYIDDALKLLEHENKNFIIDSRMAWHFVPSAFSVYLSVALETSAERILNANRHEEQYADREEAMNKIILRRKSEKSRYMQLYGVDVTDLTNYDCVIDTTTLTIENAAEKIIEAYLLRQK